MAKAKPLPPLDELREFLDYDPETGAFTWIKKTARNSKFHPGDKAGSPNAQGYTYLQVRGHRIRANRLAWLWMTGEDPGDLHVDHVDGDRSNNAFENLRLATQSQNGFNRREAKGYCRYRNGFQAQIKVGGKQRILGRFDTEEEARAAYLAAREVLHGSFCPT